MELIISPTSYQNAIDLIALKADAIIIGTAKFTNRIPFDCDLKQIIQLISNKQTTKIYVAVNAIMFEDEMASLEAFLKELHKHNVDALIFHDYSVPQLCFEHNWKFTLHFNPETTVTSYGQMDFFASNNFKQVSLARELFLPEIKMIGEHKNKKVKLEIQVQGFSFIMHSRWQMLRNFEAYLNNPEVKLSDQKVILIKEALRKWPNLIFEDQKGTHMFSGYEVCAIDMLKKIQSCQIDVIRIDPILHDDAYSLAIYQLYQKALKALDDNKYDETMQKQLWEAAEKICDPNAISHGFLGTIKDVHHLEKAEEI